MDRCPESSRATAQDYPINGCRGQSGTGPRFRSARRTTVARTGPGACGRGEAVTRQSEAYHAGRRAAAPIDLPAVLRFADAARLGPRRRTRGDRRAQRLPGARTATPAPTVPHLPVGPRRDARRRSPTATKAAVAALAALARGALLGARGNSGVIARPAGRRAGRGSWRAPTTGQRGRRRPRRCRPRGRYAAVGEPVEGTILTVARAAAEAAGRVAARPEADRRARGAWPRRTRPRRRWPAPPEQLAVLHDAGVVDAGGRGLCVVLDAARRPGHRRAAPRCVRPRGSSADR